MLVAKTDSQLCTMLSLRETDRESLCNFLFGNVFRAKYPTILPIALGKLNPAHHRTICEWVYVLSNIGTLSVCVHAYVCMYSATSIIQTC